MSLFDFFRKAKSTEPDKNPNVLESKVLEIQDKYNLEKTGVVNGDVLRRALTEQEARTLSEGSFFKKNIICNKKSVPIEWGKVELFTSDNAFSLPESTWRKTFSKPRNPKMFVVHWDVCLSSKICFKVLKNRNLSVHFMIDNDGTIHQLMDTQHAAKHSGSRIVDIESIGVEISDAYYPKYQESYEKMGFGKRPIWINDVQHAKEKGEEFLGFYDIQLEALKALIKALHKAHGIKLQVPTDDTGMIKTIYKKAATGNFEGIVNHYHLTTRKIDCAALKLDKIVEEVKDSA